MGDEKSANPGQWSDEILAKFVQSVVSEIAAHVKDDPDSVIHVNEQIREWLDRLDTSAGGTRGAASGSAAALASVLNGGGKKPLPAREGAGGGVSEEMNGEQKDAFGRNLLSRLREIVMLDLLSKDTRAFALHEIKDHIGAKGFESSDSAVNSQLHRLHNDEHITKPANGMYAITAVGREHLARLKASHGSVLEDWLGGKAAS